jgi:AcrR family transcriptional regulator
MTERLRRPRDTSPATSQFLPEHRRERRDAAENRKLVLNVAQRLFLESGVEAVSMHQIAQAAGVGQGTLYRRYAHKGELCLDLMAENAHRFRQEIEEYLAQSRNDTSALERLTGVLSRAVQLVETKTSLLAAFGDACWGDRRMDKFRTPWYQWMHGTIAMLLADAVAKGELRDVDATFTADALIAALSPDVYQFQRLERGLTPEEILRGVCRIFAGSSGAPPPVSEGL